jgi:hypothetical protein
VPAAPPAHDDRRGRLARSDLVRDSSDDAEEDEEEEDAQEAAHPIADHWSQTPVLVAKVMAGASPRAVHGS